MVCAVPFGFLEIVDLGADSLREAWIISSDRTSSEALQ